jgi:hypothetical protein
MGRGPEAFHRDAGRVRGEFVPSHTSDKNRRTYAPPAMEGAKARGKIRDLEIRGNLLQVGK